MSTDNKGHYPTAIDRWLLVRYKKFATKEEIPRTVSSIMMRRVHDKARVHTSIGLIILTAVGMFANAVMGKRAAKAGDTMEKRHKEFQESYNKRKEEELAKLKQ